MPFALELKKAAEKLTGLGRPAPADLPGLLKRRRPRAYRFLDDGHTPNNPFLPLVIYRGAVKLAKKLDPAAIFEELFASHGWEGAWRDGIHGHLHFHTGAHEVLGFARGGGRIQFGGVRGRTFPLKAGDVVILPAGTGHCRIVSSDDLLVVGAYSIGDYDEPRPGDIDHAGAQARIARVPLPAQDPVYGPDGPLADVWPMSRAH